MDLQGPVAFAGAPLLQDRYEFVEKSASDIDEWIGLAHHKKLFCSRNQHTPNDLVICHKAACMPPLAAASMIIVTRSTAHRTEICRNHSLFAARTRRNFLSCSRPISCRGSPPRASTARIAAEKSRATTRPSGCSYERKRRAARRRLFSARENRHTLPGYALSVVYAGPCGLCNRGTAARAS